MKVDYKNELGHQLMMIRPDEDEFDLESYEFRMILENPMDGILEIALTSVDDENILIGDISGKVQLLIYLKDHRADAEFIDKLIIELVKTISNLEKLLVSSRCVVIDPKWIFIRPETKKFYFTVLPVSDNDFSESMCRFSEYLITRLPQNDKKAAEKCYNLYQTCIKGNITLERLKVIEVLGNDPYEKPEENRYEWQEAEALSFEEDYIKPVKNNRKKKEKKDRKGAVDKVKDMISKKIRKKEPLDEADEYDEVTDFMNTLMPADTDEVKEIQKAPGETVILSNDYMHAYNTKAFLIPKDIFTGESVPLKKESYILGKRFAGADIEISGSAVSRKHAMITKTGDTYEISDIGSKNGTAVNGIRLGNGEHVLLSDGDEINFADVVYFFHLV